MSVPHPIDRTVISRWVRVVVVVFLLLGLGFGSWLSRLPAVRDALGATAVEMSIYGLCLALGSLVGLSLSGRIISRFSPRVVLTIGISVLTIALPGAAAIILHLSVPLGLIALFAYGFAFSICDVAANVSGANAEALAGKPRLPLMHAGYSLGAVASTGLGAAAEALDISVPLHLAVVTVLSAVVILPLLRALPQDERVLRLAAGEQPPATPTEGFGTETGAIPIIDSAAGQQPAFTTLTGSIPIITDGSDHRDQDVPASPTPHAGHDRPYSPWRDRRILLLGFIALAMGIIEGTSADWLPIALVDGRGVTNQLGSMMLSVFFAAVFVVRLAGSPLLLRFGRVTVMRASAACAVAGVAITILVPGTTGLFLGVIAWGLGTGLGWPVAISAAADRPDTAARDVGAVSALGYGAMLLGPVSFGFLGEHVGLLTSFWALPPFAIGIILVAGALRPAARH